MPTSGHWRVVKCPIFYNLLHTWRKHWNALCWCCQHHADAVSPSSITKYLWWSCLHIFTFFRSATFCDSGQCVKCSWELVPALHCNQRHPSYYYALWSISISISIGIINALYSYNGHCWQGNVTIWPSDHNGHATCVQICTNFHDLEVS